MPARPRRARRAADRARRLALAVHAVAAPRTVEITRTVASKPPKIQGRANENESSTGLSRRRGNPLPFPLAKCLPAPIGEPCCLDHSGIAPGSSSAPSVAAADRPACPRSIAEPAYRVHPKRLNRLALVTDPAWRIPPARCTERRRGQPPTSPAKSVSAGSGVRRASSSTVSNPPGPFIGCQSSSASGLCTMSRAEPLDGRLPNLPSARVEHVDLPLLVEPEEVNSKPAGSCGLPDARVHRQEAVARWDRRPSIPARRSPSST